MSIIVSLEPFCNKSRDGCGFKVDTIIAYDGMMEVVRETWKFVRKNFFEEQVSGGCFGDDGFAA